MIRVRGNAGYSSLCKRFVSLGRVSTHQNVRETAITVKIFFASGGGLRRRLRRAYLPKYTSLSCTLWEPDPSPIHTLNGDSFVVLAKQLATDRQHATVPAPPCLLVCVWVLHNNEQELLLGRNQDLVLLGANAQESEVVEWVKVANS